jgi:hypothetical protein
MHLKGFKDRSVSGGKHAWVFRHGHEPELDHFDNIAQQHHFYSPPDPNSLDETITNYENRLTRQLYQLRKAPLGPFPDPAIPAEVISHLTMRTESMRTGFGFGAKQMALTMFQALQDDENIRRLLSLEGDVPDERFKRLVTESLKEYESQLQLAGLSPEAAERIAFVIAKERFPQFLASARPTMAAFSAEMYQKADELVAKAQRKALAESVVPAHRVEFLSSFSWETIAMAEPVILPDCVAIALEPDGRSKPLLLADKDAIRAVIVPLDHKRLLVGRKSAECKIRPFMFNLHAVSCSESFFVSSQHSAKLEEWAGYIGVVSKDTMIAALKDAFANYSAPALPPKREADGTLNLTLTFKNADNQVAAEEISTKMKGVLAWAAQRISLDRIDAVVFTDDVAGEAAHVERGFEDGPAEPLQQGLIAKTVSLLKDENVHVQLVMSNNIAVTLLADSETPQWGAAVYHVLYMVAEANCAVEFDKSFPGIMLRPHISLFNLIRYEPVSTAWTGYISSRFSTAFWPEGIEVRRGLVKDAIEALKAAMPGLVASFKAHNDHSLVIKEITPFVTAILVQSACLAGLADGREVDVLADEDIIQTFRAINLAEWYPSYVGDLRAIWNTRGQWRSEKEFMSLSCHTERILWQCGMILTEAPGNQCRLEFPNIAAIHQAQRAVQDVRDTVFLGEGSWFPVQQFENDLGRAR